MCSAKEILCKIRHYASTSFLKNVYLGLVYPYLQYSMMTWGNTIDRRLKILSNILLIKTKLSPLYE